MSSVQGLAVGIDLGEDRLQPQDLTSGRLLASGVECLQARVRLEQDAAEAEAELICAALVGARRAASRVVRGTSIRKLAVRARLTRPQAFTWCELVFIR